MIRFCVPDFNLSFTDLRALSLLRSQLGFLFRKNIDKLSAEIYEELFRRVLSMCVNAGLVSGGHQSMDSTLAKANARLDSTVRKEPSLTVSEDNEEGPDETEEKEERGVNVLYHCTISP